MNWTRRQLARLVILGAAATLTGTSAHAQSADAGDLFFVGSRATQLSAARIDPATGDLTLIGTVAEAGRPSWSVRHPTLPVLYVTNEVGDATTPGTVLAYRIDPATGALAKTGEVSAGGAGTTHLWFDARSNTLVAANYTGGSVASIAVNKDGSLGERVSLIQHDGSGPHRRQTSPHAHGVAVDPSGRYVLAADLGVDKLFVYPLDPRTHKLSEKGNHLSLPAGSGPRHFAFHPNGRTVYLLGELSAEVFTLRWDARRGALTRIQQLSTDAPGFDGNKSVAEVAVSHNGRFVYVSNRGDNMIVVHAADPRTGTLRQIQRIAAGGTTPWAFTLHRSGRWMLVANTNSDRVNLLAVDQRTGLLTDTGKSLSVPKPVSVTFDRTR